jgi:hypothetical protein
MERNFFLYSKDQNPSMVQDDIETGGDNGHLKELQFNIQETSNSYIAHYLIAIK